MLEPEQLLERLEALFVPQRLAGRKVLMTAGPTFEPIDAVRGITNISSGKMGYALARACRNAGAEVTLVSGPTGLPCPEGVQRLDVGTAREMYDAVLRHAGSADIFIGVAAVADYRVRNRAEHKLKKGDSVPVIELEENPDILATVASLPAAPFCVGFAAESRNLLEYADAKRRRKKVPLLVANLVQKAMGRDTNEVLLLDDAGSHALPEMDKQALAARLVEELAARLPPA